MNALWAVILLASSAASAQLANLPDLAGETEIGRVKLYASARPLSWLQPTAFESEMTCTGTASSKSRTCEIRIFNRLNQSELAKLEEITKAQGLGVVPFSNIDNRVVPSIRESFEDLPAGLTVSTRSMETLRLAEGKMAYGSMLFRLSGKEAEQMLNAYKQTAQGRFVARFSVNVTRTELYLAIRDGNCLRQHLQSAPAGGLEFTRLNGFLDQGVRRCGTAQFGFADDERLGYLRPTLRADFFQRAPVGVYVPKPEAIAAIGSVYEAALGEEAPHVVNCEMSLELRAGAEPQTVCR